MSSLPDNCRRLTVACYFLVTVGAAANCLGVERADVVYRHGRIYTVNEKQPLAESLAVRGGTIIFVGADAEVAGYQGTSTRVVDLEGRTVVPGLTDSHCHLSGVGARELNLNLEGTTSLADFLAKVKTRVERARRVSG